MNDDRAPPPSSFVDCAKRSASHYGEQMGPGVKQQPSRRSLRRRGGVPPARRDLFAILLVLVIVDALAALLLVDSYYPRRRSEVLATAPKQLSLLARDRQNALTGWVNERLSDAELTASLLAAPNGGEVAPALLDRFLRTYGYESAFLIDRSGTVLLRRGAGRTADADAAAFARETIGAPNARIDFRRTSRVPRVFTACAFTRPDGSAAVVLFVSDPYAYVYPLFSTATIASRTGETNLIGLYDGYGVALNPYPGGTPPPMTFRLPISKEFERRALNSERAIPYVDRRGVPVIGVAKRIPRTPWVLVAKMDEQEVLAGAVAETVRLGQVVAVATLLLAVTAFVLLRSRRVSALRAAEDQLARLFENSTTGIITFRVLFDDAGAAADHQVVDMNPAAEELFGVTAAAEIGKRSADAAYLRWPATERARNYDVALAGGSIRYETFNDALERWYETRSFSPRHGQFAHLVTDITERRKSEEAVRTLSARLLRVQDDERRRIARELHETVAQTLASVRMNLGMLKRFTAGDARAAVSADDSIASTDEAITQIRTLSYLLHPPMIDQAGLPTALRWYIEGFERRSGIATTIDVPADLGPVSHAIETSVFRIVQESLTNIQRHSGSSTASVSLRQLGDRLSIEISDQGHGLPPAVRGDRAALLASGVGIAGINERIHEAGGELTIESSDHGTTLRVLLPVGNEA